MGFFNRLLNLGNSDLDEKVNEPKLSEIYFGRYSDNNKSLDKTKQWFRAESLFQEKNFRESLDAFFDYLKDDQIDNVQFGQEAGKHTFKIYQGSKIILGWVNEYELRAEIAFVKMNHHSIPVLRRVLEMNHNLSYCSFALHDKLLVMIFDTTLESASPDKLYYGLKELATQSDKQDDLLSGEFKVIETVGSDHVVYFSAKEMELKYNFFMDWIQSTLKLVEGLNQDRFSGGIGYLLLDLIYKIDYLIVPEGKLLLEIERINNLYWANLEEFNSIQRNQLLKESLLKLSQWNKEEILKCFYRVKSTFSISIPKLYHAVSEGILATCENAQWYIDKKHHEIALSILEYGFAFAQFSYSLPKPCSLLFALYMQINHQHYFESLGLNYTYYKAENFNRVQIEERIKEILIQHRDKYPLLLIHLDQLNYRNLITFNMSFLREVAQLNFNPI